MNSDLLRKLPKVDEILNRLEKEDAFNEYSRSVSTEAVREIIKSYREDILNSNIEDFHEEEIIGNIYKLLVARSRDSLKKVINASGTIIHTNLGRSILPKVALDKVLEIAGSYSNLEYDLEAAKRGSRYSHVEDTITKITGAEAAIVVNNNAAAVLLVMDTLAKGKEAIVSRGELVEIGGSFRIPEVMSYSGSKLVEVGTTNKTHLYDYENNINENTGVILKVHTSNYKIIGFTETVEHKELSDLGKKYNIPIVEDLGSGVLVDLSKYGLSYEPRVQDSIRSGVDVVTFSGDKLLGGPQAGIIIGKKAYIDKIKKNQLTRALRIDKMTLAALEAILKLYLEEEKAVRDIPTLYRITSSKEEQEKRAEILKRKLETLKLSLDINIKEDFSVVGGGSLPMEKIQTYVIAVTSQKYTAQNMELVLRSFYTPIIARINKEELILDLRTIDDSEFSIIVNGFKSLAEVII